MKKKLLILIAVVIITFAGITFYNAVTVSKGYEINKIGSRIEVAGELIKDNEYRFYTNIQLGDKVPLSSSILQLNFFAQVEFDKNNNTYILKNPKLEITPIACEQYDKGREYFTTTEYSANYQFGIKPYQAFKQTMAVGYAKLLSEYKNIQIHSIENLNSQTKINSVSSLRRAADNDTPVMVDYNVLDQYFSEWYNIKFTLLTDKKGVFSIN